MARKTIIGDRVYFVLESTGEEEAQWQMVFDHKIEDCPTRLMVAKAEDTLSFSHKGKWLSDISLRLKERE